jgi:hypothetical protein
VTARTDVSESPVSAIPSASPVLHVVPDRRKTVRAYARLIGGTLALAFLIQVLQDWRRGDPPGLLLVGMMVLGLLLVSLAAGFLLYELARHWHFTLDAAGVTGFDSLCRERRLAWDEIGEVRRSGSTIEVIGRAGRRNDHVGLETTGVDIARVHKHLVATAGPDHPLTRMFAAN